MIICKVNLGLIERIDQRIRFETTGNQREFSYKLGISRQTLNNYLNYMKDTFNLSIKYSRENQSYYYEEGSFYEIKLGKK